MRQDLQNSAPTVRNAAQGKDGCPILFFRGTERRNCHQILLDSSEAWHLAIQLWELIQDSASSPHDLTRPRLDYSYTGSNSSMSAVNAGSGPASPKRGDFESRTLGFVPAVPMYRPMRCAWGVLCNFTDIFFNLPSI